MTPQIITSEIPSKSSGRLVPRGTDRNATETQRHREKEKENLVNLLFLLLCASVAILPFAVFHVERWMFITYL
jgi:hypothetical protein